MRSTVPALLLALALLIAGPAALRADEEPVKPSAGLAFLDDPESLEAALEAARAAGKDLVIDFTAEWCGWCHRLEDDVFAKPEAVKAFADYLCVRFDVDKPVGGRIAQRFHVNGYPTVLFLDTDGTEIDRISGYSPLEPYLEDVARISRDESTLRSLAAYVADHEDDLEVQAVYMEKLVEANPPEAARLLPVLIARCEDGSPTARARLLLITADSHRDAGRHDEALAALERVVREVPGSTMAFDAGRRAAWLCQRVDPARGLIIVDAVLEHEAEPVNKAALLGLRAGLVREQLGEALTAWARAVWDDGQALNEVAWEAWLRRVEMGPAIAWAERAVELTKRDPAVLDTLANLLFEAGRLDEAIEIEMEALRTCEDPDMRRSFQEVLLRFRAVRHHRQAASER